MCSLPVATIIPNKSSYVSCSSLTYEALTTTIQKFLFFYYVFLYLHFKVIPPPGFLSLRILPMVLFPVFLIAFGRKFFNIFCKYSLSRKYSTTKNLTFMLSILLLSHDKLRSYTLPLPFCLIFSIVAIS